MELQFLRAQAPILIFAGVSSNYSLHETGEDGPNTPGLCWSSWATKRLYAAVLTAHIGFNDSRKSVCSTRT